ADGFGEAAGLGCFLPVCWRRRSTCVRLKEWRLRAHLTCFGMLRERGYLRDFLLLRIQKLRGNSWTSYLRYYFQFEQLDFLRIPRSWLVHLLQLNRDVLQRYLQS